MSAHHEGDELRVDALLAPLDAIEPARRTVRRRSGRRLLLTLAVAVVGMAAAGVAIAAGLGAFSGTTTADLSACKASTIAFATPSGAQVLTGHADKGVYCVAYKDANGAVASSAAKLGETPVGQAVALEALDTATNTYVIVGVVPPGYNDLAIGAQHIPVKNQAFVVDAKSAASSGALHGPAGNAAVNLGALLSP
jgi:hypothetical protein